MIIRNMDFLLFSMSCPTLIFSTSVSGVKPESFWADLKHAWREQLFHTKENIGRDSHKFAI